MSDQVAREEDDVDRRFLIGLARAFAGAMLFALPMLMTEEMWQLGFYMDRWRLVLLLVVQLPLLVGLSYMSGFEPTFDLVEDAVDACAALAVGFVSSAALLALMGVIGGGTSADEVIGKVALHAVPASMGALLAQSQLGGEEHEQELEERGATYWGELFLMAVGALFFAFNMAPTEEMLLIAFKMNDWQVLLLAALSLAAMHGFVYAVEFSGQEQIPTGGPVSAFFRLSVVGYALALLVSAYVLWTFGRFDGTALLPALVSTLVLGFPAAIGAAAARLVL
ncbi:MAG TPA: TIGR02587 family membrane protein [Gemmatimonadaceae bacterium]|nr:TIGR02587 family membrane protein [Gemmatimonadaceae bacterium]